MDKTNTALLLSGGVDSAVAATMLCRQGIKPDCFYIKIGPEEDKDWDCTAEEDIEMAQAIARKYGLNFDIVDCHREYWQNVARYTIDKMRQGLTPNPDVMCNRLIKFGAFEQKQGRLYDTIATGHYAQTELDREGRKWLVTAPDPVKDQTDFLCQLTPEELRKACFPIGHMVKDEVRQIAEAEHLVNAHRKDSQGICFLGKIDYNEYIKRYLGECPGDVIDLDTGKKLGRHTGLWFHTIGQRRGLGFSGGPWFVVKKDMEQNILFVSRGYDPETVYKDHFLIHGLNLLTPGVTLPERITIKIRHTADYTPATIQPTAQAGQFEIISETKIHGVAPGQFCVIYDREHHRCFGSGEITL